MIALILLPFLSSIVYLVIRGKGPRLNGRPTEASPAGLPGQRAGTAP